jgi:hypothetical protein
MVRVDHRWGSKDNFFFRFNFNGDQEFDPNLGSSVPGYGTFANNHFLETGVDWTHQFTPALLNEFKFAYNRYQLNLLNQDFANTSAQQTGHPRLAAGGPARPDLYRVQQPRVGQHHSPSGCGELLPVG